MKVLFEKKVNRWIIGAILGTTLLGVTGYSMTPKGKKNMKGFVNRVYEFFKLGFDNLKQELEGKKSKKKDIE